MPVVPDLKERLRERTQMVPEYVPTPAGATFTTDGFRLVSGKDALCQEAADRIALLEGALRVLEAERQRSDVRLVHLKRAVAVAHATCFPAQALAETEVKP